MRKFCCTLFFLLGFSLLCFSIQLGISVDETTVLQDNKEIDCLTVKTSIPRSPVYHLRKGDVLLSMELLKGVSVFSLETIHNNQSYQGLTVADVLNIRDKATLEDSIAVILLRNNELKQMIFPLDPVPPQEPFITLNTDMHTSEIRAIDIHEGKHILATVSYDKTLKIWDAQALSLLHTIRFPTEAGNSGKLYSIAISPDGSEIACGAYGGNWEKSDVIYIVDVQHLTIKKVIRGLENIVTHLSYSPDGQYLLAAIRNHCEFAVFDTQDYSRINAFYGNFEGASLTTFSPDGQSIVSVGNDSTIRLFEFEKGQITLKAEKSYDHVNAKPFTATFSPDGKKMAVGFHHGALVEILEVPTLNLLEQPTVFEGENAQVWVHTLRWSPDGQSLFGGVYSSKPALIIWQEGKMNASKRVFLESAPLDLAVLGDRLYFCTEFQTIGFYDPASEKVVYHESDVLDYTNAYLDFYCSPDGSILKIPFGMDSKDVFFDMSLPGLTENLPEGTTMIPPITYSEEMTVKNWRNSAETVLNGKRLGIKPGELSRALSINPLNGHFTIGTDWYLYHFDEKGDLIWSVPVNSTVCGLNTCKNGKLIIALLSNGTFEWIDAESGEKQASLFLNKEGEWLFWTSDNDYITSSESASWFGWQQNRDKNSTALFTPQNTFQQKEPLKDIPDFFFNRKADKTLAENNRKSNHLYILACAVEAYDNEQFEDLSFAIDDAKAIIDMFQNPELFDVQSITVHELYGDELNHKNLLSVFDQLKKEMRKDDLLILFFAGHGFYKQEEGIERFYFKYPGNNTDGLSLDRLNQLLNLLPNQNSLIITDSCYSGAIVDYFASQYIKNTRNKPEEQKRITVVASTQAWTKSPEITELGHGLFTHHLLSLISKHEQFNMQKLFGKIPIEIQIDSEEYLEEVAFPSIYLHNQ